MLLHEAVGAVSYAGLTQHCEERELVRLPETVRHVSHQFECHDEVTAQQSFALGAVQQHSPTQMQSWRAAAEASESEHF